VDEGFARHPSSAATGGGMGASAETEGIMAGIRGAFTSHPGSSGAGPTGPTGSSHGYSIPSGYPSFSPSNFLPPAPNFTRQAHSQTPGGDEEEDEGDSEDDEEGDKARGEGRADGEEGERKRPKMTRGSR
jgi:hypothetical protein